MKRIIFVLAACLLFTSCTSQTTKLQNEKEQLTLELKKAQDRERERALEMDAVKVDLERSEINLREANSKVTVLEKNVNDLSASSNDYLNKLSDSKQQVKELQDKLSKSNQKISELQADIADKQKLLDAPDAIQEAVRPYAGILAQKIKDSPAELSYNLHQPLDGLYSPLEGMEMTDIVASYLHSFAEMTELVRTKLTQKQLEDIGNTDGALQLIGFSNMPISMKGIILEQNYLIKYYALKADIANYQIGAASMSELEVSKEELINARMLLQEYIDTQFYGD